MQAAQATVAPKVVREQFLLLGEGAGGTAEVPAPGKLAGFELPLALGSLVLPFLYLVWSLHSVVIPLRAMTTSQLFLNVHT